MTCYLLPFSDLSLTAHPRSRRWHWDGIPAPGDRGLHRQPPCFRRDHLEHRSRQCGPHQSRMACSKPEPAPPLSTVLPAPQAPPVAHGVVSGLRWTTARAICQRRPVLAPRCRQQTVLHVLEVRLRHVYPRARCEHPVPQRRAALAAIVGATASAPSLLPLCHYAATVERRVRNMPQLAGAHQHPSEPHVPTHGP